MTIIPISGNNYWENTVIVKIFSPIGCSFRTYEITGRKKIDIISTFCIDAMSQELVKTNHLFFFTSEFPFGKAETFIETEILYLSKSFQNITIISHDINTISIRNIPENVKVLRVRYPANTAEKLLLFEIFISKNFLKEVTINSQEAEFRY